MAKTGTMPSNRANKRCISYLFTLPNDQPGVAARIAWAGAGVVVPLGKVSVKRLQKAIKQVLTDDSYKKNALMLQEAIRRAGGVSRAADIIEQVVFTGKPVLS